jgi:hypothetical protein
MLEHVAGALQEVLVAFGGEMTEVDRCGRAIAAHRALALVSRVRSEESPAVGRSVWARGTRAECMERGGGARAGSGPHQLDGGPIERGGGPVGAFHLTRWAGRHIQDK